MEQQEAGTCIPWDCLSVQAADSWRHIQFCEKESEAGRYHPQALWRPLPASQLCNTSDKLWAHHEGSGGSPGASEHHNNRYLCKGGYEKLAQGSRHVMGGSAMKAREMIRLYLDYRHSIGDKITSATYHLNSFAKSLDENLDAQAITKEQSMSFVRGDKQEITKSWFHRHVALNGLCKWAFARGTSHASRCRWKLQSIRSPSCPIFTRMKN